MIHNAVTIGNALKQMNGTNLELNFQLDIYRSKSWTYLPKYILLYWKHLDYYWLT